MAEEKKKLNLTPFQKKIVNIVIDVVIAVVLLFALLLAVSAIRSKVKGYGDYTEVFGSAYIAVESPSMEKDRVTGEIREDNFAAGDLIKIKILKEDKVNSLKVGDVITFRTNKLIEGKVVLNTHRIIKIKTEDGTILTEKGASGVAVEYTTKGDNNTEADKPISVNDVVGVFKGKSKGIGKLFLFMNKPAGFVVCVLLPTLLVVGYCTYNLIVVVKKEKKVQTTAEELAQIQQADAMREQILEEERERLRAEVLAEMQAKEEPVKEAAEESKPAEVPAGKPEESVAAPEDTAQKATEPEAAPEAEAKPKGKGKSKGTKN